MALLKDLLVLPHAHLKLLKLKERSTWPWKGKDLKQKFPLNVTSTCMFLPSSMIDR